jgi:tRNA(Arg) A34 adenosine deaminase TadA
MQEWKCFELGWKKAFENSWEAFKINTIPIGCIIQNENNDIVASGRNMIYSKDNRNMKLCNTRLAHAEINTILLLDESVHPNIRKYTLYTTMEPCILCYGAIVMGNIRLLKFAAKDGYAGATSVNNVHEYSKSRNIKIEGPIKGLEYLQICLQSYSELKINPGGCEKVLKEFEKDYYNGVIMARNLFQNKILEKYCEENKDIEYVYNKIMERVK